MSSSLISVKLLTVSITVYCGVSCKKLVSASHFYHGFVLLLKVWNNNLFKFMESLLKYFLFPMVSPKVASTVSIFLNSINRTLEHAWLLAFSDNVKILYCIDSQNVCLVLQNELNKTVAWANKLGLDFNIDKCHYMTFTP